MSRGHLAAIAFLVLGLSIAPVGVTAAVQSPGPVRASTTQDSDPDGPTINASINGDSIGDGDFRVVMEGARLQLDVSMAGSNATLDTVLVRVDGETVVDRSEPGNRITLNRSLPISGGNNTVRIVAEASNDVVRSMQFRVYLESVPPALDLQSPVDTLPTPYQYPDLVVERTSVRLAGHFEDLTGFAVASFAFRLTGHSENYRSIRIDSNRRFEERVLLQYGTNLVQLQTQDVLGNSYFDTFRISVVDRDAPALDLEFGSQRESRPRYTVTGTVNDTVWVRNVSITVFHYNHGPFQPATSEYVPVSDRLYSGRSSDRLSASFRQEVRLIEGTNLVAVRATDAAGHSTVRRFLVEYSPDEPRPPTISVIRNSTVVRNATTLALTALVSDGDQDLTRVLVEARNLDTGEVTDVESIRPADNATYLIERQLNISAGINQIDITAFDARGNRSVRRFFIDTSRRYPLADPPPGYEQIVADSSDGGTSTTTVMPVSGPAPTPATATAPQSPTTTVTPPTTTRVDGTDTAGTNGGDGADGEASGGTDESTDGSDGGLFGGIPLLPTLGALVVVVAGSFVGYRRLTRV